MAKRKPASKPQPKPEPKRERGRPIGQGFHPSDEQRGMVKAMAGYKIPEDEMVLMIINPKTTRPISKVTLIKHFRKELDTGFVNMKMRLMAATYRNALGEIKVDPSTGATEVVREGNVTAQIWLGKTMLGMRERVDFEAPAEAASDERSELDAARRVAFTMAQGAHILKAKKDKQAA